MRLLLLGLDCGLTVTKAVVHDAEGNELGRAEARVPQATPHARWVERDPDKLWRACAVVIRDAIAAAGAAAADIAAVGATGHGDGVYLVDSRGAAARPAILSMDTRAVGVVDRWRAAGIMPRALELTGQAPWPAAPAAVLAWLAEHEPAVLERAEHALGCKDYVKLRLTGAVSTDPTEASQSFTDVRTQAYSPAALELYGLDGLGRLLPPVVSSAEVAGTVTVAAARETGLREGTPVVSGIHDVDACAIATGVVRPGRLSVVAGSFSINQCISDAPAVDPRWSCRSFGFPGRWMNMAVSPASATNLEWFARTLVPGDASSFEFVEADVASVAADPREVWYLPFLYGSPVSDRASGSFVGLRGWHRRGHLVRALLEGVVFNHRMHVDALRSAFPALAEVRLTGGGSRSAAWVQMFADALGLPVVLTATVEAGALGAAMCAGIGAGVYADLDDAASHVVRERLVVEPMDGGSEDLTRGYERYLDLVRALGPFWDEVGNPIPANA